MPYFTILTGTLSSAVYFILFQIYSDSYNLLTLCAADLHSLLDVAKVADSLVFVLDSTEGWDTYGDYCLSCLFAQGLTSHGECKYEYSVGFPSHLPHRERSL